MPSDHVHIISFDNPSPPDYGGAIDVFYKLKFLKAAGMKIVLHAFTYGRKEDEALEAYCEKVYYYPRRSMINPLSPLPYIVLTRRHPKLIQRLLADDAPILFEGIHTCYYLSHPGLKKRFKMVRMHNIEHDYYENLKEVEPSFFKKIFFGREAARLRKFEPRLSQADAILAISENDATYLRSRFHPVYHITAFHPNEQVISQPGLGNFALYHGKLSVGENDEAARFLVDKVFRHIDYPLVIAGNNPSDELYALVNEVPHVTIHDNLNTQQISELIREAHINVLPTFQATGIKLKLINVLYQGRFVLANQTMVSNTGCESLCNIANSPEAFIASIEQLSGTPLTEMEKHNRVNLLDQRFNNLKNATRLSEIIKGGTSNRA